MRLGIISDSHDHLHHLRPAIDFLSSRTEVLLCCGDLCSPFVVDELKKYPGPVHIVFGNNDADLFRITKKCDDRVQAHGEFIVLEFNGFKVAMNHFDNIALPIAASKQYGLVCFGHNHRYSLEHFGETIALNPGAIMGVAFGKSGAEPVPVTFATFDTDSKEARLWRVPTESGTSGWEYSWNTQTEPSR